MSKGERTMIKVTIELESAITGETSVLGVMCLANDGTGGRDAGNYNVAVMRRDRLGNVRRLYMPIGADVCRAGRVEGYPRLAYNVWRLIARGLLSAFPEERK